MRSIERVFEIVLRLYPRAFRDAFGEEMRHFVRARLAEPRHATPWGSARVACHLVVDGVVGGMRERAASWRAGPRATPRPTVPHFRPDTELPEELMVTLVQDARYAVRTLRRRPAFTLVSAITLALGVGATSAIFGVVDALLFRPLRYPNAHEIVVVTMTRGTSLDEPASYPDFIDWREQARSFQSLAVIRSQSVNLTGRESPERLSGAFVSASFFSLLGADPLVGRLFTPDETEVGTGRPVAVLSEGAWRRLFGADESIVGRTLVLNGNPLQVIGIVPSSFNFFAGTDVWLPITYYPNTAGLTRKDHSMTVVGRLKPS